jgi:cyclophilin family peptidyl-prolyl cis-trans isomerase
VLGTLPADAAVPRLITMLADSDRRVIPSVLTALVKCKAPNVDSILLEQLKSDDVVVRSSAASNLGELTPATGPPALIAAYEEGKRDPTYLARAAALAALAKYGPAVAVPVLKSALTDKDWAVRVRAAALLKELDPSIETATAIRPAPSTMAAAGYDAPSLTNPSVAPQVYLDTEKGTIQIELAVLDAPLTAMNFIALARKGFFNGLAIHRVVADFVVQDGDPRGDGEGGPGYTIRDELNELPYLRGTVGMALDWNDTGGSQWFITHSPQPHLDARYTAFGRVTGGMDVVDRLEPWDVIRFVRVWDGKQMTAR